MVDAADALGFGDDRLDEYNFARQRRSREPRGHSVLPALTIGGAVLVGYLLAVSFSAGRSAAVTEDQRKTELVELVREQREHVIGLNAALEDVDRELAVREQQVAAVVPALNEVVRTAELQAGVTGVTGPGVVVSLFDAPPGCTGAPYLCRVQDYDLQLAVNTLFAAGAEAISIGPQRIIATTAIRSAGSQITANYRFLAAPYVISAVGAPDELFSAMQRDGLAEALEAAGSGLRMEMRRAGDVEVPGISTVPAIRVARPVRGAP